MKNEEVCHQVNNSQNEKINSSIHNKKNLTILKNIKGITSFMNNSTNYWSNTFKNALCGCDRTEDLTNSASSCSTQKNSIFKVTRIISENCISSQIGKGKKKDWTKKESELLYNQYYNLNNKDINELKKLFPLKTANQIVKRIKKYEMKLKLNNFSRQDDLKIIELVDSYGKNWKKISSFFEGYPPDIIERRFKNKLDPKLKHTKFSSEEDEKIITLYNQLGNKWKEIASFFPDRNVNMIKNRYYSFLKRKMFNSEQISSYEKECANSCSIDTNSIIPTTGTLVNEELNFKFQEDLMEQEHYDLFNLNEPIIKKGDSEEEGFFRNNSNENDYFFETCQKVFPNETIQKQDYNDNEEHLNKDLNEMFVNCSNSDVQEKTIKNQTEIEEIHKLFKQSNNLEEILHKIDSFQYEGTKYNMKLLENNKVFQELLENKEKASKHQQLLYSKLNELKQQYVKSLKGNQSQMKVLIEINNTLLQLISIAKLQVILSKQIKDIETEASKEDNNKMKVDSYGI